MDYLENAHEASGGWFCLFCRLCFWQILCLFALVSDRVMQKSYSVEHGISKSKLLA